MKPIKTWGDLTNVITGNSLVPASNRDKDQKSDSISLNSQQKKDIRSSQRKSFLAGNKLIKNLECTIWEMADLEYIKYTFVDEDEIQRQAELCCHDNVEFHTSHEKRFNSLFEYIDSIGQINFINEDEQLKNDNKEIVEEMDNTFKTSSSDPDSDDDSDSDSVTDEDNDGNSPYTGNGKTFIKVDTFLDQSNDKIERKER